MMVSEIHYLKRRFSMPIPPPKSKDDELMEKLIAYVTSTNLVALDKTLSAIKRSPSSYAVASAYTQTIAEIMVRAAHEVGMTLEPGKRA